MRHGKKGNIRINGINIRVFKQEIGKPFEVGMNLVKRGSRKFPGSSTGDLCSRMVNEEAYQLTTGITGSPDNGNFHKIISDYKNLMLFRRVC